MKSERLRNQSGGLAGQQTNYSQTVLQSLNDLSEDLFETNINKHAYHQWNGFRTWIFLSVWKIFIPVHIGRGADVSKRSSQPVADRGRREPLCPAVDVELGGGVEGEEGGAGGAHRQTEDQSHTVGDQ